MAWKLSIICPRHLLDIKLGDCYSQLEMTTQYPISGAARLTGIPLDTLRAWERRYGAVVPVRTARGRAYSQAQIERLLLLREAVAQGHAIGQVASVPDHQLGELLKRGVSLRTTPRAVWDGSEQDLSGEILGPVLQTLDRFDYAGTERELNRLAATVASPRELVHRVALPLMRSVGERWHEGKCGIAQEHMISNLLTALLSSLVRTYSNSNPAARVLLATPQGERHGFPILAAAMMTAAGGLGVIYLGTELPAADLIQTARRSEADAVLLSISAPPTAEAIQDVLVVGKKLAPQAKLWLGSSPALNLNQHLIEEHWLPLRDFTELESQLKALGARF